MSAIDDSSNGIAKRWPAWLHELEDEDLQFIRRFVLGSGSLKDLATEYGVSYPTVRLRLDRLINKIKIAEESAPASPFDRKVKILVSEGQISAPIAKQLLQAHRSTLANKPQGEKP